MTAIVLPDIDRSTLEDLKTRMPTLHLSEIELPSLERVGHQADRAIDRILGRSRPSIWPWLAAGLGIAAIIGTVAALWSSGRRPAWPESRSAGSGLPGGADGTDTGATVTSVYDDASMAARSEAGLDDTDIGIGIGEPRP
jgi:hypothetical protein